MGPNVQSPGYLSQALQGCGLCVPFSHCWALIAVGMSVSGISSQASFLWGLVMTTKDELCVGWPHRLGFTVAGLYCLLTPPFGETNWVVLWYGLKTVTSCVDSGASSWRDSFVGPGQPLSVPYPGHLVGATVNLWWVAAYAGLQGAWEWLYYKPRLAATNAGLGTALQELQGTLRATAACSEIVGKTTGYAMVSHLWVIAAERG